MRIVVVQSLSFVQLFANPLWIMPGFPCPSPNPRACSNSCPSSQWCYWTISSSVVSFSWLQSFPASGSFLMSRLFESGGQSTGGSASAPSLEGLNESWINPMNLPMKIEDWCFFIGAAVLPMNIQGRSPLGLTGLISLRSKGLSGVFSSTTVQKHQFCTQPLVWFLHPYTTSGKTIALTIQTSVGKVMSLLLIKRGE